jgi:Protein of unknown function (DUF3011)
MEDRQFFFTRNGRRLYSLGERAMSFIRRLTSIVMTVYWAGFLAPLNAQTGALTCSSSDGSYRYCQANTQNHVQLIRQLPGPQCRQGYSWGFDYRGIWVDRGCSAQFAFGQNGGGDSTGAAVAAGILGAIVLGAVVASANSDDHDDRASRQRDYYSDGYRMGQRDWDANRPPYYMAYRNRYPQEYESSFASGYDAGYNNRRNAAYRNDSGYSTWSSSDRHNNFNNVPPNDPNRGTINNPGNGVSGYDQPREKIITCSDNSGRGNHCHAVTFGGVELVRQRSGSPCTEGYSWGADNDGIWVAHGCRADFVLHGVAAD